MALLAAGILVPCARAQGNPTPGSKAWSVAGEKGGRLYSMSFAGGPIHELKQLWTNAFTNDNFLINFSDKAVELPAFQMRDMTLPELARSIAFISKGGLTVDVVERNDSLPGNIWRVARPTREALSHSVTMRAVAAPHLFASEDTLKRFLDEARQVQRNLMQVSFEVEREDNSRPLLEASIQPLQGQRVFVLIGHESGVSGLESLIKAAEQTAAEPVKEPKSGK